MLRKLETAGLSKRLIAAKGTPWRKPKSWEEFVSVYRGYSIFQGVTSIGGSHVMRYYAEKSSQDAAAYDASLSELKEQIDNLLDRGTITRYK